MNDNLDENTSSGAKSRFRERLKKIARDKRNKNRTSESLNSVDKKKDLRVIFKPFLIASSFLYGVIRDDKKQKPKNNVSQKNENTYNYTNSQNLLKFTKNKRNIKTEFNQNNFENNERRNVSASGFDNSSLNELIELTNSYDENYNVERVTQVKYLQKDVINLIRKRLVKIVNELEMLNSEFYILSEFTKDDIYLKDCQERIKEAKKMLSKIKSLKEKYDYLKDNIDFDNLMSISDDHLIDKILELKNNCTSDVIKYTIDDYKILEEYKKLYFKIDKMEEDLEKYNKYKNEKAEELKRRDIDFDELKNKIYNEELEQRRYNSFVSSQSAILRTLDEKMQNIDSHEVITYKLKGFNNLLFNSFKYLGLLIGSPLSGIFPGIAIQTAVTKNMIRNLYFSLEWEKERKMVYETIDFSTTISAALNDLGHTLNLVNATLDDVRKLKEKYKKDFSKYQSSMSEYLEAIKKLNKIENSIINNKIKIQLMQEKMRAKEKENDEKLKLVKKLNCSSNN